ncbi:MAG TPA: hypothetical protein VLH09_11460 [Bryobacteraceae bacterium]|nr:hypothetical protein [Bryobacteraceae bacterium]
MRAAHKDVLVWEGSAAAKIEPSGTAVAIVDIVRAGKLDLVVIDGSSAMEGRGFVGG